MKSNFAEHLLKTNHSFSNMEENIEILDYGSKGSTLNCKEDFNIYVNSNLNAKNDFCFLIKFVFSVILISCFFVCIILFKRLHNISDIKRNRKQIKPYFEISEVVTKTLIALFLCADNVLLSSD